MLLSTSLCHVLMRKLSLMIPFRGKGGRLCRLIGYFVFCNGKLTGSDTAANQTEQPAGYRLVKTCSLFFWPSTDTRDEHRQSHLLVWDAVLQTRH